MGFWANLCLRAAMRDIKLQDEDEMSQRRRKRSLKHANKSLKQRARDAPCNTTTASLPPCESDEPRRLRLSATSSSGSNSGFYTAKSWERGSAADHRSDYSVDSVEHHHHQFTTGVAVKFTQVPIEKVPGARRADRTRYSVR